MVLQVWTQPVSLLTGDSRSPVDVIRITSRLVADALVASFQLHPLMPPFAEAGYDAPFMHTCTRRVRKQGARTTNILARRFLEATCLCSSAEVSPPSWACLSMLALNAVANARAASAPASQQQVVRHLHALHVR